MAKSRHSTKDKGDLALIKVIADLRQHGIFCCLPLSEHLPFDLIAVMPDMTTLVRVQVKYRSAIPNGTVLIEFKSNYYDSQKIYSKPVDFSEIDAYAVFIPDIDQVCYFRTKELRESASSLTLRFEPPKNNQRKGVNLVEDFSDPYLIANYSETIEPAMRQRTLADEVALSRYIVYLQQNNIYPLIAHSNYLPFDLTGVSADMQTIERYSVFDSTIQQRSYTDRIVRFGKSMDTPQIIFPHRLSTT